MRNMTFTLALALGCWISTPFAAHAQRAADAANVRPHPSWTAGIGTICNRTARTKPSPKARGIALTAKDEYYYFGGHRIDSSGRLFGFGVVESEQEESEENITTYRLGHLGWWQVLRYWRLLAQTSQPIDAARRYLRLRGFADATIQADDTDIPLPGKLALDRALLAIDNVDAGMKLSRIEKEILKEALIRAAINDVAWSAAFISAVMRQSGLADTEFDFSEAHGTYIYKAFSNSQADIAGAGIEGFYRACPLTTAAPRLGDLVCYHRHVKQFGSKSAAGIHDMILDDLSQTPIGNTIHKSHCDVVAHVDLKAAKVYVVGGNVQQAVTVKKLALRRRDGTLSEIQPDRCKADGAWTFPKATPGKPVAPHLSDECLLNRRNGFVLLQARL